MEEELQEQKEDIYRQNFLVLFDPLNNIEIINYFNYEPRINSVFSRNNLTRIKDGAYVVNVNDKNSKRKIGFQYLLTEI